jgi:hypothetical protein
MDKDYGRRADRKPSRGEVATKWIGVAVALAVVLAIVAGGWMRRAAQAAAEAPYWTVSGPPCPVVAGPPAGAPPPREVFDYADVSFARAYGHASCALMPDRWTLGLVTHPVCQFTSPFVLKVSTAKGAVYFLSGPGKPATVSTQGGVARCVLNANFR